MSREREEILQELADAIRTNQRATDAVDEATTRLLGINRTDGNCIDILDQRAGPVPAGELARELNLTTGAITAVIDRLERAGYARRVSDPADRRRVLVEATEEIRLLSEELFAPMMEMAAPLIARYDDEQLELFLEFLQRSTELQERHAALLRDRLAAEGPVELRGSARTRPGARTAPE